MASASSFSQAGGARSSSSMKASHSPAASSTVRLRVNEMFCSVCTPQTSSNGVPASRRRSTTARALPAASLSTTTTWSGSNC